MNTNTNLIQQVKNLPNGTTMAAAIQNSGIFTYLTVDQAIGLLNNVGPQWRLTIHEAEGSLIVVLYVEEGEGVGAYANPPTMDDEGNPL